MANSLIRLTLESNQYERGIQQAHKLWNDFTKGLGMSLSKFTATGTAIGAVTGALKVAKDAFHQNQLSVAEWGRVCAESESLYKGFLNALNGGDISGYLNNMDAITNAARHAYNAIGELARFNAFNQINTQKARTGFSETVAGFRLGENTREDLKAAAEALKAELRMRKELEEEAYTNKIDEIAKTRGVQYGDLEKILSGNYGSFKEISETPLTGVQKKFMPGGMFGGSVAIDVPMAVDERERLGEAVRKLTTEDLRLLQAMGAQAERTETEVANVDKQVARMLNARKGGGGGGKGGSGGGINYAADSIAAQEALVAKLTQQWKNASAELRDGYLKQLETAKNDLDYMTGKKSVAGPMGTVGGVMPSMLVNNIDELQKVVIKIKTPLDVLEEELQNLTMWRNSAMTGDQWQFRNQFVTAKQGEIDAYKGISKKEKTDESVTKSLQAFTGGFSEISSGLKIIGLEVPSGIDMAIEAISGLAAIIQGVETVISIFSTTSQAANTAALTANTAALWAVAATNWIPFANGGVAHAANGLVTGNSYSGDHIPAMLNAGEVVLTAAMAGNLASQLQGGGLQNLNLTATIWGEQIRLVLNNNGRRTGCGEYVTSNFR